METIAPHLHRCAKCAVHWSRSYWTFCPRYSLYNTYTTYKQCLLTQFSRAHHNPCGWSVVVTLLWIMQQWQDESRTISESKIDAYNILGSIRMKAWLLSRVHEEFTFNTETSVPVVQCQSNLHEQRHQVTVWHFFNNRLQQIFREHFGWLTPKMGRSASKG